MTTVPCRKESLKKSINSIIQQTFHFDKLVVNIDDYMSSDDYNFYFQLKELDERIEVNICDKKWRSCNKLIPTLKKYPDDVIITIDDDIFYPNFTIEKLINSHLENPDCIVSHNSNAIFLTEDFKFKQIGYFSSPKIFYKFYNQYLSNCCLFPPHIFDGSDLFDYNKMMACTNGTHDELWFWVNSTINGVKSIVLNDFFRIIPYNLDECGYRLGEVNEKNFDKFNELIVNLYSDKINKVLEDIKPEFIIDCNNIFSCLYYSSVFNWLYGKNFILNIKNLDISYKCLINQYYNNIGCDIIE